MGINRKRPPTSSPNPSTPPPTPSSVKKAPLIQRNPITSGLPNQKMRGNQAAIFYRFMFGGFGYGSVDFISKYLFGEGSQLISQLSFNKQLQPHKSDSVLSNDIIITQKNIIQNNDISEKQQQHNPSLLASDSTIKCFIYGVLATNIGSIFHEKVNKLFQKRQFSAKRKLIFSPFAFLPFYVFCGIYDRLSIKDIASRIAYDFIPLLAIRLAGDILRHKQFSSTIQPAQQTGSMLKGSNIKLLALHTFFRGGYVLAMDTLYHQRVKLF